MGRKNNSGAVAQRAAAAQRAAPAQKKHAAPRFSLGVSPAWLGGVVLVAAVFIGFRRWINPLEDDRPTLAEIIESAQKNFNEGLIAAGIDDLVVAQTRDVSSSAPAEILGDLMQRFSGAGASRHLKSAVHAGMERLQMVLYDELYNSSDLQEEDQLLQLAKWKMLYHPLHQPQEASAMLFSAQQLLSTLARNRPISQTKVHDCSAVCQQLAGIAQERVRLSAELRAGRKTSSALASEILPEPLFKHVDRRSGLSLKEYREEYLEKRRPVIITDYAERIFATSAWNWEEMRRSCGDMKVIVSERSSEARHLWAGLGNSGGNTSLGEWMKSVQAGTAPRDAYLMDWGLVGRCNKFVDNFVVPKYFASDLWKTLPFNSTGAARDFFARHPSVFVGATGSGGALHVDSYASTFWQLLLKGRKRWTLYAMPDRLRRTLLYAGVEHEIMPLTPAPGEKFDAKRLPLLEVAEEFKVVTEVSEGELMVVPHDVPHMVENVEDVLAISMNVLDEVAVPRLKEDLHARSCFSSDEALYANIDVLEAFGKSSVVMSSEVEDTPFGALKSY